MRRFRILAVLTCIAALLAVSPSAGAADASSTSVSRVQLTNSQAISNFWGVQYSPTWTDFHCKMAASPGSVLLHWEETILNGAVTVRQKQCHTSNTFLWNATSQSITRKLYARAAGVPGAMVNPSRIDTICWSTTAGGFRPSTLEETVHKLDGKIASRTYRCMA